MNAEYEKMWGQFAEDMAKDNVTDVIIIWSKGDKPGLNTAFMGDIFKIMGWMSYMKFDMEYQIKMAKMQRDRPTIVVPTGGRAQ